MKPASKNILLLFLVIISVTSLLPVIGLTHYHTKGEPREAIVAVSMLQNDNWVLPENNGGDMAYKPPMFHWAIALSAVLFNGSEVNEFTSRFPSALAAIIIAMGMFLFYTRGGRNKNLAFLSALVFLSAFETHRGATSARVDMLLTMFIVLALFDLYRWSMIRMKGVPLFAILCMSAATLTKGPVGIVLPCLVSGVFLLFRKERLFPICYKLLLVALAACVLPACWYYMAYLQGGQEFIDLVIEENFKRFTGKMSYVSHHAPPFYYLYITLAGFLPWTLLALFSLFALSYTGTKDKCVNFAKSIKEKIAGMDPIRLFSVIAIFVILFFYLIPKSKRSVYLLPIYPFIAYFLADYMCYLVSNHRKVWRVFGIVLATIAILFVGVFIAFKCNLLHNYIPEDSHYYLTALQSWNIWDGICLVVIAILLHELYISRNILSSQNRYSYSVITLFFWLQFTIDTAVLPDVLNRKSDYELAQKVEEVIPEGKIYSYIKSPMMRFFVINFYTDNRVVGFEDEQPQDGFLLVGEKDFTHFAPKYCDNYEFTEMWKSPRRGNDIRDIVCMYRFTRKTIYE